MISLIKPTYIKVLPFLPMNTQPDNEFHCTHVVNCYRGKACVDRLPFIYEGNDVVNYALDLLKKDGKLADRIEITTL